MCGIAGFVGFDDKLSLAQQANFIQKHRGPDHQATWNDDYIAFAHQRLSIIDLSERANQPFEKYEYVMIFNGEIYNYRQLKEDILKQNPDIQFKSDSDTEVVLEYYHHYGEKCLNYFIGMFSFAIYHKQTQELFIARDHFGIKPLFYTLIGKNLAFASELKTLVSIPTFDKTIDYKALISSLNYLWVSGNNTMFKNCYKLPPAHYLKFDAQQNVTIKKYWHQSDKLLKNASEEEIVEKLAQAVEDSMERHMVADVPISSFLSGGLDSSILSVLAKKQNQNLSTYTIATSDEDKKVEKMPEDDVYARKLAKQFEFDHNEILIEPNIVNMLPQMVKTLDEPIGDPAAINTFMMCEAAKKRGVKVILSGMGADEILFGYRRQKAILFAANYQKIPKLFRSIIKFGTNILPVKIFGRGIKLVRWGKRFLQFASLPLDQATFRSCSYYEKQQLQALLKEDHEKAIDAIEQEYRTVFKQGYDHDLINQLCQTDMNLFMVCHNLTYTDRASMAASVEVRVPFIDKELIEYVMQIPGKFKFKKKESKYILKKVAEKYLPHNIIYRPKAGFGAPIRSWISGALKPMVDDLLSKENVEKRGIFNYEFIKNLIEKDRKGVEDNAYHIYQLLTIELWFREFVDKNIPITADSTLSAKK